MLADGIIAYSLHSLRFWIAAKCELIIKLPRRNLPKQKLNIVYVCCCSFWGELTPNNVSWSKDWSPYIINWARKSCFEEFVSLQLSISSRYAIRHIDIRTPIMVCIIMIIIIILLIRLRGGACSQGVTIFLQQNRCLAAEYLCDLKDTYLVENCVQR